MTPKNTTRLMESLAVFGVGLFSFGVYLISPPACYILSGLILCTPLTLTIIGRVK